MIDILRFTQDDKLKTPCKNEEIGLQSHQMNNKPNKATFTTNDFESMSWHDNMIHGLSIDAEEWKSDLILDIDYIVEWLEAKDCKYRFAVAPATLTFHDVDKLSIHFELEQMRDIWIFSIDRQPKANSKAYDWVINLSTLNVEKDKIAFESTGFTQVLRANPVISEDQHLETSQRKQMELSSQQLDGMGTDEK